MDPPKTRKETKKDQREKARYNNIYTAKHVRLAQIVKETRAKK